MLDPVAEPGEQDDEDPARAADDQQRGEVLEDVLQQGEAGGQHAGTLCRYVSVCVCMRLDVSVCIYMCVCVSPAGVCHPLHCVRHPSAHTGHCSGGHLVTNGGDIYTSTHLHYLFIFRCLWSTFLYCMLNFHKITLSK